MVNGGVRLASRSSIYHQPENHVGLCLVCLGSSFPYLSAVLLVITPGGGDNSR